MTVVVQAHLLKNIKKYTIEEFISSQQSSNNFPFVFQLNSDLLSISSHCNLNINSPDIETLTPLKQDEDLSLVVFSDITIASLIELCNAAELILIDLSKINQRNSLTSYRFSVQSENLERAKQKVAEYSLNNKIECALLLNAPKLHTPGLLVMDMDSTTIEIECIDEIAALAGVGEQVAEVTELAMQGKLDFAQSLHQRVGTLENAPEKILSDVAKNIPLMPGLETLITALKEHNWRIAIASGGFTYFADHLKELLNLDATFANVLEIKNGLLTGKVLGDVVDAQVKAECLLKLSGEYYIPHKQTIAMGDGANDLVMMEAAHLGVAFHAKPIVLKQADTTINYSGLDCLLHWLA